jgi:thiamine biosynthesis lipoprotein
LKGFLADRAAEALRDRGVADAVVDAGGDIVAFGVSSDGEGGWPVAVEVGGIREQLVLRNGALSSSSMEQQPGHIKDARTGAAASQLAGVFVTAPEGVLADAYATGAFAFGGLFRVPEGVCVTAIRAGGRMESTCPVGTGADQGR